MIEHKTLTESVVEHLRIAIISGELPGGMRLNETVLSTQLNISRPPLREAMQILEQKRLIISSSRKGRFVEELSEDNLRLLWQCREMMECYAIQILEQKGIRSIPIIEDNLKEIEEYSNLKSDSSAKVAYLLQVNQIHQAFVDSAENPILSNFYSIIRDNVHRYLYIDMFEKNKPFVRGTDHARIYSCIQSGQYEKARKALRSHLTKSVEHIVSILFK
jgi:DNA-binding GntR family transcriptional regulator